MKKKRKWYDISDEFFIAWFLAMTIFGILGNPRGLGGFAAGINAGLALEKFFTRKFKRLIERHRLQDEIDLRTIQDIIARADYDTAHQIGKAAFN